MYDLTVCVYKIEYEVENKTNKKKIERNSSEEGKSITFC